jgi:hypothetical protein
MTRIRVFRSYSLIFRFFLIFGSINALLGLFMLIRGVKNGFNTIFPSDDWNGVIFLAEGLLFIIMGAINLANNKYYIEWDENELRLLMPDTKKPETIKFNEIKSVDIMLFEIQLKLKDRLRNLELNTLRPVDLQRIKKRFEEINIRQSNT